MPGMRFPRRLIDRVHLVSCPKADQSSAFLFCRPDSGHLGPVCELNSHGIAETPDSLLTSNHRQKFMAEPLRCDSVPVLHPRADTIGSESNPELLSSVPSGEDQFWLRAGRSYGHMQNAALTGLRVVRRSAAYVGREKPVELILSIAAAGVLVGAGLRIWRKQYE